MAKINLKAFKDAGLVRKKNTKCVDWYSIDGSHTHLMMFLDRENRVKTMRSALKKMKFGHTFEWQRKGTGIKFMVEKDWDYPKEEFDNICKYGFASKRKRIYNIYTDRGDKRDVKVIVLSKKWEKDPNWHGEVKN